MTPLSHLPFVGSRRQPHSDVRGLACTRHHATTRHTHTNAAQLTYIFRRHHSEHVLGAALEWFRQRRLQGGTGVQCRRGQETNRLLKRQVVEERGYWQ